MPEKDSICEFTNQGNVNFIIIKNSETALKYEEYATEALRLCDKFDKFSNLNMNVIFIHNIIEDNIKESNGIEDIKNHDYESQDIKLKNNNINIMILKNLINIRSEKNE